MEAYKPYLDNLMANGVAETGYILSRDGVILATSLPIKELPKYDFKIEDEKNPSITHDIIVDERVSLLEAVANNGVAKQKYGVRLYNQKYYPTRSNEDPEYPILYFRKVVKSLSVGSWRSLHRPDQANHCDRYLQHWKQDVQRSRSESRRTQQASREDRCRLPCCRLLNVMIAKIPVSQ